MYLSRELWEVSASCHGPEDPPAALLKSAQQYREPLLVLLASCYEVSEVLIIIQQILVKKSCDMFNINESIKLRSQPNAVDVLWGHWILASIEPTTKSREDLQAEISQNNPAQLLMKIAEVCIMEGYINTLHESFLIFMPVIRFMYNKYSCYSRRRQFKSYTFSGESTRSSHGIPSPLR